jgi:hypothetical protein
LWECLMPQAGSSKISDFLFSYHPVRISPRAETDTGHQYRNRPKKKIWYSM